MVLPPAGPGVGEAALIAFIGAWNESLIPLALISDAHKQPIALGLFRAHISYTQADWGFLAALSVIYVIPAVVFYVVARRALQQSVAGAWPARRGSGRSLLSPMFAALRFGGSSTLSRDAYCQCGP